MNKTLTIFAIELISNYILTYVKILGIIFVVVKSQFFFFLFEFTF